uniref:Retrotransposon Copia-like N-terminal domain-containing protein n=1 Tax=Chenopodium quinoa TaxID=63459 RepID=A0A803LRH9_CHEQI
MVDESKIDPSSPFYLGSVDQPGNLISHVILKGDNYLVWSRAITLSLKSKRKFGFVDGTISKPSEKKKILDWETVNSSMLVSWVLRSIDTKIAASVPYFEEAKNLWDYLEKRLCEANGPRLQQLRAAITGCTQSKNMSIEEYYTKLMGLFDVLTRLKPPHDSECGKCECDVAGKYAQDKEEEQLHQFLIGIDDDHYALEERSRGIALSKEKDEAHVFALSSNGRDFQSTPKVDKSRLFCSHFKHSGHDNMGCFVLHGYPDWWLEKYGKKGGGSLFGTAAHHAQQ